MTEVNEQIEQLTDIQRRAMEPASAFGSYAIDTFEAFMRQNFAVMGDCVDYARTQAKLLGQADNVSDYVGQQVDQGRNFAEKMAQHVQQYATLANNAAREAADVTREEVGKLQPNT